MDGLFSFFKRRFFNWLLIAAAIVTIVVGAWGWSDFYDEAVRTGLEGATAPESNALFWKASYVASHTVRAFLFGDVYAVPWSTEHDPRIALAGWLGAFVAASALVKGALRLFVAPIERWYATQRSKHIVVLGSRSVAIQASEALHLEGWKVTYHGNTEGLELPGVLQVPRSATLDAPLMQRSVRKANRIIVAEETDAETAQSALTLARIAPDSLIFAVFQDPWLATNLRQSNACGLDADDEEDHLIAVSETRALARTAVLPTPPFKIAERAGHSRPHVLLFGYNDLTVSAIEETLYANVVPHLKHPRFTILTPGAYTAQIDFEARHPGLTSETKRSRQGPVDITFIESTLNTVSGDAARALKDVVRVDPVSLAIVTVSDDQNPLGAALMLQAAARQHRFMDAPILVQGRKGIGMEAARGTRLEPLGLYSFGHWSDLSRALGLLDPSPDVLAKEYHENFRRNVLNNHGADQRWEVLSEAFRMANRNAILHLPAKLSAMGFDIEPYLTQSDALSPSTAPEVHPEAILIASEQEKAKIAVLEHERWMMERWVSGWRHGARDNDTRRHPNLVPFDELDEQTRNLDSVFVDWIVTWIDKDEKSGLRRGSS